MKVQKLGIEWGAAFEEAQPVRITHGDAELIVFVSERLQELHGVGYYLGAVPNQSARTLRLVYHLVVGRARTNSLSCASSLKNIQQPIEAAPAFIAVWQCLDRHS